LTKTTKILLLATAALAAWYVPTIMALRGLTTKIVIVLPTGIFESKIDFRATIKLTNLSSTILNIKQIKADIILNGTKIAQFIDLDAMVILANAEQQFNVAFTIDMQTLGDKIWQQLLAANLQNAVLQIKGTIIANGKILPIDTFYTIKDITL
jgi:LEA14-like dessication related protein